MSESLWSPANIRAPVRFTSCTIHAVRPSVLILGTFEGGYLLFTGVSFTEQRRVEDCKHHLKKGYRDQGTTFPEVARLDLAQVCMFPRNHIRRQEQTERGFARMGRKTPGTPQRKRERTFRADLCFGNRLPGKPLGPPRQPCARSP